MRLIDTHTHLDFPDFDSDREPLLSAARAAGVERVIVLGVEQANWQRVWDTVCAHPGLHAALGLHPVYLEAHQDQHLEQLRGWLQRHRDDPRLCAVGEFGLDFYLPELDRERQQHWFEAQLQLAVEFELPALLHVRRSHAEVIATLKRHAPARGGIVHAFAGSFEQAREYIKLGFKLGLGGAATWPQALRLRKTLPRLPLDSLVLETDAPDMAPAMFPAQRNSPLHLPDIATALAEVMGIERERLAEASSANARSLFGWSD